MVYMGRLVFDSTSPVACSEKQNKKRAALRHARDFSLPFEFVKSKTKTLATRDRDRGCNYLAQFGILWVGLSWAGRVGRYKMKQKAPHETTTHAAQNTAAMPYDIKSHRGENTMAIQHAHRVPRQDFRSDTPKIKTHRYLRFLQYTCWNIVGGWTPFMCRVRWFGRKCSRGFRCCTEVTLGLGLSAQKYIIVSMLNLYVS